MTCESFVHTTPVPELIVAQDAWGPCTRLYVNGQRLGHIHTVNTRTGILKGWKVGPSGRIVVDRINRKLVEVEEHHAIFDLKCRHCDETFFTGPSGTPQD